MQKYVVPDCATEDEAIRRVAAAYGIKDNEILMVEVSQ
jgi:hypothetical protein